MEISLEWNNMFCRKGVFKDVLQFRMHFKISLCMEAKQRNLQIRSTKLAYTRFVAFASALWNQFKNVKTAFRNIYLYRTRYIFVENIIPNIYFLFNQSVMHLPHLKKLHKKSYSRRHRLSKGNRLPFAANFIIDYFCYFHTVIYFQAYKNIYSRPAGCLKKYSRVYVLV